jgi:hypothetical protein
MGEQQRSSQPAYSDALHEDVCAALPEYAAALVLNQIPWTGASIVAAHLESCSACRDELETLLELVVPSYTGQLRLAPSIPQFDLSFLPPPRAEPAVAWRMWVADNSQRLGIVFSDALLASLRAQPQMQATRGQALYRYRPDPPPGNLSVTIDVFAGDDDPALGNVQVLVDVSDRDPFALSGFRVTLWVGERMWEETTGETGSAIFAAIPLKLLPQLRVEIALPPEE